VTEREFQSIVDYATDLMPKSTRHRFEGRGVRIQFLSDDEGIIEIRYIRKPSERLEDL
jgi:hypothetical protein